MCAGRVFFALRGWEPTEEGAAYAPGPGLRSSGGLELGWWTCAPPGVSPKTLLSRREKEDAGASGQWLRGWRPMELWGSYTGPGLHVPGMALACAEDRYSFCGTKGRGAGGARQPTIWIFDGTTSGECVESGQGARSFGRGARRRETRWTDGTSIRRRSRSRRGSGGSFRGRGVERAHLRVFARSGAESERRFRDFPRVHLFAEEGHQSLLPH